MKTFLRCAALSAVLAVPNLASAQSGAKIEGLNVTVNGSVALGSNYLFRGISQTANALAAQATFEFLHDFGIYVGGFVSTVDFRGTDGGLEVDGLIGFRKTVFNDTLTYDLGFVRYAYPGQLEGSNLNYNEFVLKLGYALGPVTLLGFGAYSPEYTGKTGTATYVEGGVDFKTPVWDIVASGRLGYQWIEKNTRAGIPDFSNWSVTLAKDLPGGFTVSGGYYDTSISEKRCFPGSDLRTTCAARGMLYVTWKL